MTLRDASTGKLVCTLPGAALTTTKMEFSPDGTRLFAPLGGEHRLLGTGEAGREAAKGREPQPPALPLARPAPQRAGADGG